MFLEEALWVRSVLDEFGPAPGQTVLDLGSSTEEFRRLRQPYIDFHIFRPLRRRGVSIVHVDARAADGVDVVLDLTAPGSLNGALPPAHAVVATNLLEHVTDRKLAARRFAELTLPGGLLIVTAPHVYRFHADPIDTMYRPTHTELEALWPRFDVLRSETFDVAEEPTLLPQPLSIRLLNRALREMGRPSFRAPTAVPNEVAAVALRRRSGDGILGAGVL